MTLFIGWVFLHTVSHAQQQTKPGKLAGKVLDSATNQPLNGVSIGASGTKYGTTSITDGSYILTLPAGTYTIRYSYSGSAKEITGVVIKPGQTTFQDILLAFQAKELEQVVVRVSRSKETASAVYNIQRRSAAASDGISLEAIKKTPDNNTAQVLKRVTGVNVQDNKFVVVRGLGGQYNQTMLNGAAMTSTETNRNAFAFDLIPASVVESITINKTATPDMPGNFAGGIVQINTKDFPDNNFVSVTLSLGFSDQTLGKDFYSDKRGSLEWMGFGYKNRALPDGFPSVTSRVPLPSLNLQEQIRYLRQLRNNLAPINYGPSGLNENIQVGLGKTIKLSNGTQFGIVAAFNHRKNELIESEIIARDPDLLGPAKQELRGLGNYSENTRYRYSVDLGGVLNLAYRFGNNKVTLKNLVTQVYKNTFTDRPELITDILAFPIFQPYDRLTGVSYFTEQRTIINNILAGEHRTGQNNETRIDWNVSLTNILTKTPDTRNFILLTDSLKKYGLQGSTNVDVPNALIGNSRVWTDNKDFIFGGAFNLVTPFNLLKNKQLFKAGLLFQNRQRNAGGTILPLSFSAGHPAPSLDSLLAPSQYSPEGIKVSAEIASLLSGSGNYTAGSSLLAAYESLENKIGDKWRIIWGLRIENYQQTVNVYSPYFFNNFQQPDLSVVKFAANTTFNFLPSVNVIFSPIPSINVRAAYSSTVIRPELKDLAQYERFDLQTFALTSGNSDLRSTSIQNYDIKLEWFPSSSEIISVAAFYKNLKDPIEYAFSDLANNLSSRFAINTGPAYVRGLEMEVRKKLDFIKGAAWMENVTLFGNGAIIKSKVSGTNLNSFIISYFSEHPLTGQPGYIINGGISIQAFKESFEATLSYNRTGDFVNELGSSDLDILISNGKRVPRRPHYWEKARDLMDLVLSKNLLKNKAKIKLSIGNLLNARLLIYQDLNGNGKFDEPVKVSKEQDRTVNYVSGVDNTASWLNAQRNYSLSISYTF